jgi:hypothetical protein
MMHHIGQRFHKQQERAHPKRDAAQDAASSTQNQVAGIPAAAQAALLQTVAAALSKSWRRTRGVVSKQVSSANQIADKALGPPTGTTLAPVAESPEPSPDTQ